MTNGANDNVSLWPGEDSAEYADLRERIAGTLKANDLFEQFWIDDLTNQLWERARYQRLAIGLLQASQQRALQRLLAPMIDFTEGAEALMIECMDKLPSENLSQGYFAHEATAMKRVDEMLQRAGLTWDAVQAEAMALRGTEFQRINQLQAKAETRRAATLRAIERHRRGLGTQLEAIAQEFVQAKGDDAAAAPTEAAPTEAAPTPAKLAA